MKGQRIEGFEVVEQFLDYWKADAIKWWNKRLADYNSALAQYEENYKILKGKYGYGGSLTKEERIKYLDENFPNGTDANGRHYWVRIDCFGKERREYEVQNAIVILIFDAGYKKFHTEWKSVEAHLGKKISYEDSVLDMIEKEYNRKYTKLVSDVQYITGNVEKADLRIGATRNIEGSIEGKNGKAELWSTYVEGYIQSPHFRFYCHRR